MICTSNLLLFFLMSKLMLFLNKLIIMILIDSNLLILFYLWDWTVIITHLHYFIKFLFQRLHLNKPSYYYRIPRMFYHKLTNDFFLILSIINFTVKILVPFNFICDLIPQSLVLFELLLEHKKQINENNYYKSVCVIESNVVPYSLWF